MVHTCFLHPHALLTLQLTQFSSRSESLLLLLEAGSCFETTNTNGWQRSDTVWPESRSWGEYSFLLAVSWVTYLWDPALRLRGAQATWSGHITVFWPRDPARLSKIAASTARNMREQRFRWFQPRIFQLRPQTSWSRDNLFHWCLSDFQKPRGILYGCRFGAYFIHSSRKLTQVYWFFIF